MRRISRTVLVVVMAGLAGCGGGSQTLPGGSNTPGAPTQYATGFPDMLPQDGLQPWEQLGTDGNVMVGNNSLGHNGMDGEKAASATGGATEFFWGRRHIWRVATRRN